jgi:lysozyme family protein
MSTTVPATYEACLAFVEGPSRDGSFNDSAPGEAFVTHYGVTQYTWGMAVQQGIVDGGFSSATTEQCAAVMRALYWNSMHCSSFAPGIGLMLFNDGVLCGTGHATRLVQRIVGAAQDGVVGPQTLRLANSFGVKALIDAIVAGDDAYFAALKNAPLFLHGWLRRESDAQKLAYQMAGVS